MHWCSAFIIILKYIFADKVLNHLIHKVHTQVGVGGLAKSVNLLF